MNQVDIMAILGRLDALEERVKTLEQATGELDQRTIGMVPMGPMSGRGHPTSERLEKIINELAGGAGRLGKEGS